MSRAEAFRFRLDSRSGVPVYRQLIDQVLLATASGVLGGGAQLPTVRQVAVDLAINPNTVMRAYKELEIRGVLTTQQGLGTFVTPEAAVVDEAARSARLSQLAADCAARAGAEGYTVSELLNALDELKREQERRS
jgi:GntR family transcriptional regulator